MPVLLKPTQSRNKVHVHVWVSRSTGDSATLFEKDADSKRSV